MAIIQSGTTTDLATVSPTLKALRTSQHPVDTTGGGAYSVYLETGSVAAGAVANSEILQFRNPSANPAIIERVDFVGFYATTAFTAGIARVRMQVARSWTVDGTGGATATLSGDNNQLRQTHAAPNCTLRISTTAALGAGTKTLDSGAGGDSAPFQALKGVNIGVAATVTNTSYLGAPFINFFGEQENGHPLVLAQNEGFVIKATVPATGVWLAAFTVRWTETSTY